MKRESKGKGIRLGLTGGIGCGKSTVAGLFKEAGWSVISTDEVVRELLAGNEGVIKELRERWGAKVFDAEGRVQRGAVAELVFSNREELQWLENLLHPLVHDKWVSALEGEGESNWVVEIPLLFEKRLEKAFDFSVCVSSPEAVVIARMASRGYSRVTIKQRSERQMAVQEKMERADYVITNSGSLEFLNEQTRGLISDLID
jgi:dephospho-CoA kinase